MVKWSQWGRRAAPMLSRYRNWAPGSQNQRNYNLIARHTLENKKMCQKSLCWNIRLHHPAQEKLLSSLPRKGELELILPQEVKQWTSGTRGENKHSVLETHQCDKRKDNNTKNNMCPVSGPTLPCEQNKNLPRATIHLMALLLTEQPKDAPQHIRESSEPGATSWMWVMGFRFFKWLTQKCSHWADQKQQLKAQIFPCAKTQCNRYKFMRLSHSSKPWPFEVRTVQPPQLFITFCHSDYLPLISALKIVLKFSKNLLALPEAL